MGMDDFLLADNSCIEDALKLFSRMAIIVGLRPNNFSLTSLIKAAVSLSSLALVKALIVGFFMFAVYCLIYMLNTVILRILGRSLRQFPRMA